MRAKYDFQRLKDEFVRGGWFTVADFFREKGIPNNSRTRSRAKGWREEKLQYQREIISQTQKMSVESEAEIRLRQQKAARFLQYKGLAKLKDSPIETASEARKLIVEGMEQEREALGLNREVQATQVNIGYLPKTELDKFIERASYEQLLELIAKLRRPQMGGKIVTS